MELRCTIGIEQEKLVCGGPSSRCRNVTFNQVIAVIGSRHLSKVIQLSVFSMPIGDESDLNEAVVSNLCGLSAVDL